ncbi:hypothetical protein [uncultured Flavobacterium sp.]|uniref:hypothetical protein n=1 Tax=uncultured Flavobacterium sp. TaxID=165435 RepID=UPI0030ED9622|tara:strand:- start:1827 stop:2669 length:843 start_codon:yes stop_codon:yes gene_type:complete
MKKIFIILFFISLNLCFSQIEIDKYRTEIGNLDSDIKFVNYWNQLLEIDQNILVNTKDHKKADSISSSLMVRTALLFEIHGDKIYKPTIYLPILNLSHNEIGESSVVFWPIIEKCAKVGGIIEIFGGVFPAYEIECVSLDFYNYSLFEEKNKEKYTELREKLNQLKTNNVVTALIESYNYQMQLFTLKEKNSIGKWTLQSFKNEILDGSFEFVKMSDNNIYIKQNNKIQKLIMLKKHKGVKIFKIENEPFGWNYELLKNGTLFLKDDKNEVLIQYTKAQI